MTSSKLTLFLGTQRELIPTPDKHQTPQMLKFPIQNDSGQCTVGPPHARTLSQGPKTVRAKSPRVSELLQFNPCCLRASSVVEFAFLRLVSLSAPAHSSARFSIGLCFFLLKKKNLLVLDFGNIFSHSEPVTFVHVLP